MEVADDDVIDEVDEKPLVEQLRDGDIDMKEYKRRSDPNGTSGATTSTDFAVQNEPMADEEEEDYGDDDFDFDDDGAEFKVQEEGMPLLPALLTTPAEHQSTGLQHLLTMTDKPAPNRSTLPLTAHRTNRCLLYAAKPQVAALSQIELLQTKEQLQNKVLLQHRTIPSLREALTSVSAFGLLSAVRSSCTDSPWP